MRFLTIFVAGIPSASDIEQAFGVFVVHDIYREGLHQHQVGDHHVGVVLVFQGKALAGAVAHGPELFVPQRSQLKIRKFRINRLARIDHVVDAIGSLNVAVVAGNGLHGGLPLVPGLPQHLVDVGDGLVIYGAGLIHTAMFRVQSLLVLLNGQGGGRAALGKAGKVGLNLLTQVAQQSHF